MTRRTLLNPTATAADILYPPTQVDVPIAAGAEMNPSSASPLSTVGTARIPYYVAVAATDLRLVYNNWNSTSSGDQTPAADLVLEAGIEYAGTIYKVTFGGKTSVTINPGGVAISDPIAVKVTAASTVYVRTYTSGTGWYPNHRAWNDAGGSGGWTVTSNLTAAGSAAIADSVSGAVDMLGPTAILGTPVSGPVKTVLGLGDSIMASLTDFQNNQPGVNTVSPMLGGGGFLGRAAVAAGFGYINIGVKSDLAQFQFSAPGPYRRMQLSRFCRTALINYGTNDIAGGRTLAQVQADLIAFWTYLSGKGLRTFQTTILPRSASSTDGWLTTANQTVTGQEAVRTAFNDWLRDGAPMSGGAAVATGTAGASRCSYFQVNNRVGAPAGSHPLYGAADAADAVESARNSGLWVLPYNTTRTVTDGVTTASGATVTSATAAFTSADRGRAISVAGAGTAGALLISKINAVFSATAIGFQSASPTAVTAATVKVYDAPTIDGIHPSQLAHQAIAAALPTKWFI